MSQKPQNALMGRIALQLKLISMEQLQEATAAQGRNPEKRLGEILVELGFISGGQLEKLKQVQRDVVAKHRAKQAISTAGGEVLETEAAPRAAAPAQAPQPARPKPTPSPTAAVPPTTAAPSAPRAPAPPPASAPTAATAPAPAAATAPAPAAATAPAPAAATAPAPTAASAPAQTAPRPAHGAPAAVQDDDDSLELGLTATPDPQRLHQLLTASVQAGASDIHIHALAPVAHRLHGELTDVSGEVLSAEQAEALVLAALDEGQRDTLVREGEIDLCYAVAGVGRFRMNVYRQQRGFDAVFRSIPAEPPSLEELGLPATLARFTNYHQGMVLLTGPAGCGKSSTMAALVNLINEERDEHILTVEDPIEYVHVPKRCLVNQRHAGRDTASFARALRGALREDPDVIVIGELRDLETISLAMTAAETGHFVLATLHTNNAVRTINRMIGAFPSNEQDQVRTMLSESLRAVVSQRLVPAVDGSRRLPALEILVNTKAIGNLIRDEKTVQIRSSIQTGANLGMCLLEQSLNELVKSGQVAKEVAVRVAEDPKLITAGR